MRRIRGWGLLELMLGMALSLLLLLLMVEQLVQVNRQILQISKVINNTLELQWLTDLLRSRIRIAGFTPCLRSDHLTVVDARDSPESVTWIEWQKEGLPRFVLRHMADHVSLVTRIINSQELIIVNHAVALKYPILIADCVHAEVHSQAKVISAPDGLHVILQEPLQFKYLPPVYYAEWLSESFFIRVAGNGKQALYYKHHRVDLLSTQVTHFNIKLTELAHTWVTWILQFESGDEYTLVTRVRAL